MISYKEWCELRVPSSSRLDSAERKRRRKEQKYFEQDWISKYAARLRKLQIERDRLRNLDSYLEGFVVDKFPPLFDELRAFEAECEQRYPSGELK